MAIFQDNPVKLLTECLQSGLELSVMEVVVTTGATIRAKLQ